MFDALPLPEPSTLCPQPTDPIIIDYFAGGGGASSGIEQALGRSPNYAVNHDEKALAMHAANHPYTKHLQTSVWAVDPRDLVKPGQKVGLMWFSPDCKDHSKAKGGKPVSKNIRDLAWVVVSCAKLVKPEIIMLENVEEFQEWCPLIQKHDQDGNPLFEKNGEPTMVRDTSRLGETFKAWVKALRKLGYKVEWKELRACDYEAIPTIRKRLFLIARRDGQPIVWPQPTHGAPGSAEVISGLRKPWRTSAEIIDWSQPCPSIFDTKEEIQQKFGLRAKRPLAPNTLRRIAAGIKRYVLDDEDPFFVTYAQHGGANRSCLDPIHTITASTKDQNAIVAPTLIQTGYGERQGQKPRAPGLHKPLGTLVAGGGKHALVSAFLAQHNSQRQGVNPGRAASTPLATLTARSTQINVVAAHIQSMHGTSRRMRGADQPLQTLTAGGGHAALVSAFMTKYYGTAKGVGLRSPIHTLTTKDRMNLVTCQIAGEPYYISDIGMRMLSAREMFNAQGFDPSYIIDRGVDGKALTKTDQTRMCGNSVPPGMAKVLVQANASHLSRRKEAA